MIPVMGRPPIGGLIRPNNTGGGLGLPGAAGGSVDQGCFSEVWAGHNNEE
ncbi:hypothetical protein BGS_0744 [Beggiatoa sp. SS]|nr:hypothetical protein BGS_0744 [Beggiatoa sp. SS]